MGCGSKKPGYPKFGKQVKKVNAQADLAYDYSAEQQQWAKDMFAKQLAMSDQVTGTQLDIMRDQYGNAVEDRQRWEDKFRPMEDKLLADAEAYSSESGRNYAQAQAQAGVRSAMEQERSNAVRNLEAYGIDPSQTRSQALDLSARVAMAANEAAAGEQGRAQFDATGRELRNQAIAVGQGYAPRVDSAYGMSGGMGGNAVGVLSNTVGMGANTMGTGAGWQGQGMNATQLAANLKTQQFNNKITAQQNAEPGLMEMGYAQHQQNKGVVMGAGASYLGGMEDGGVVTEDGPKSPPGETDTIPTMLADGEYVIPADVVRHMGIDYFDRLVDKVEKKTAAKKQEARQEALPIRKMATGGAVYDYQGAGEGMDVDSGFGAYAGPTPIQAAPQQQEQQQQQQQQQGGGGGGLGSAASVATQFLSPEKAAGGAESATAAESTSAGASTGASTGTAAGATGGATGGTAAGSASTAASSSGWAAAGWWALLAAVVAGNEHDAQRGGYRSSSGYGRVRDVFTGRAVKLDFQDGGRWQDVGDKYAGKAGLRDIDNKWSEKLGGKEGAETWNQHTKDNMDVLAYGLTPWEKWSDPKGASQAVTSKAKNDFSAYTDAKRAGIDGAAKGHKDAADGIVKAHDNLQDSMGMGSFGDAHTRAGQQYVDAHKKTNDAVRKALKKLY